MAVAIYIKNGEGAATVPAAPFTATSTGASGSTFTFDDAANDLFAVGATELAVFCATGADALHAAGTFCFAVITSVAVSGSGPYTYTMTCDRAIPAAWGAGAKLYIGDGITFPAIGDAAIKDRLLMNNSAVGDCFGGSVPINLEMKSGHTESVSTQIRVHTGTLTATKGMVVVRGAAGAAVRPVITSTLNGKCFLLQQFCRVEGFNIVGNAGASQVGISCQAVTLNFRHVEIVNMDISNVNTGVDYTNGNTGVLIADSYIHDLSPGTTYGIAHNGWAIEVRNTVVKGCSIGFYSIFASASTVMQLVDSAFVSCTSHGVHLNASSTVVPNNYPCWRIEGCTIASNGGDGIRLSASNSANSEATGNVYYFWISDTQVVNNTGWGMNLDNGVVSTATKLAILQSMGSQLVTCNFHNNGSGAFNPSGADIRQNCVEVPYTPLSAAGLDYRSRSAEDKGSPYRAAWATSLYPLGQPVGVGTVSPASGGGGGGAGNVAVGLLGGAP
jgi:hypothetical protein